MARLEALRRSGLLARVFRDGCIARVRIRERCGVGGTKAGREDA